MTMDEFEILTSYRQAANPGKQVQVLAELNACGTERIIGILESHGEKVDKRTLPKKTSAAANKPKPKKETTTPKPEQKQPGKVFLTLGHLRRVCADLDDDVVIQSDGVLFTGLCLLCKYDVGSDDIRRTIDLVGDKNG